MMLAVCHGEWRIWCHDIKLQLQGSVGSKAKALWLFCLWCKWHHVLAKFVSSGSDFQLWVSPVITWVVPVKQSTVSCLQQAAKIKQLNSSSHRQEFSNKFSRKMLKDEKYMKWQFRSSARSHWTSEQHTTRLRMRKWKTCISDLN